MIARMRSYWSALRRGRPGTRFQDFHRYRQEQKKGSGPAVRVLLLALGVILVVAGPVAGLVPGPGGILVFLFGLALLAAELLVVARWLDWCEPRVRKAWMRIKHAWTRAALATRIAISIAGATLVAMLAFAVHAFASSGS
jgi:hypothetical protein